MNACKSIELALKDTLGKYAALGSEVWLWCVQSMTKDADPEERRKAGRFFPCVRIQATPEGDDDNAWTFLTPVEIACATLSADDPFCTRRADIYEAMSTLLHTLRWQSMDADYQSKDKDGALRIAREELSYFETQLSGYVGAGVVNVGGVTLPGNSPPEPGDPQTMAVNMVFHWSQTNPAP